MARAHVFKAGSTHSLSSLANSGLIPLGSYQSCYQLAVNSQKKRKTSFLINSPAYFPAENDLQAFVSSLTVCPVSEALGRRFCLAAVCGSPSFSTYLSLLYSEEKVPGLFSVVGQSLPMTAQQQ